jgi:DNA-binding transcriptional LysR family regulator
VDLRHFETFVRTAELRSFTKAADDLCLTQPTVSKQIVDLERYFEIRLIDRTKRNVELTRAGEILFKYAKDFLDLKKELVQAIADFRGLKSGFINLGASNIPGIYIIPKVLNRFKATYGGISLRMTISDSLDIMSRVERGEIDIGCVGARDEARGLDFRKFLDDTIIIVAPSSNFPESISLGDLSKYPLITREPGSGTRKSFEAALRRVRSDSATGLNVAAELTDTEAIKVLVRNGMGMAYISRMAVAEDLDRGTLKVMNVAGFSGIRRSFFIVTRKGKTVLPHVRAFIETMNSMKKDLLPRPS